LLRVVVEDGVKCLGAVVRGSGGSAGGSELGGKLRGKSQERGGGEKQCKFGQLGASLRLKRGRAHRVECRAPGSRRVQRGKDSGGEGESLFEEAVEG